MTVPFPKPIESSKPTLVVTCSNSLESYSYQSFSQIIKCCFVTGTARRIKRRLVSSACKCWAINLNASSHEIIYRLQHHNELGRLNGLSLKVTLFWQPTDGMTCKIFTVLLVASKATALAPFSQKRERLSFLAMHSRDSQNLSNVE